MSDPEVAQPPPIPDFPNANLDPERFTLGVVTDGPLNEEMQAAYDKHTAAMEKLRNQQPSLLAEPGNHACAEMSQFDPSSLSMTCEACGHYTSMCMTGRACQLCVLQKQIDDLTAEVRSA